MFKYSLGGIEVGFYRLDPDHALFHFAMYRRRIDVVTKIIAKKQDQDQIPSVEAWGHFGIEQPVLITVPAALMPRLWMQYAGKRNCI